MRNRRLMARRIACRIALLAVLGMSVTLGCIAWDLVGDPINREVFGPTLTARAREATLRAEQAAYEETTNALLQELDKTIATQTARAHQTLLAGPHTTSSPPAIRGVEFPASIPGDGQTYHGTLLFADVDGDVNRITIQVLKAQSFGNADYDPRNYLISGSQFAGTYDLYIWCEGQQNVTLQVTLYDMGGNSSNSMDFSFECY